MSQANVTAFQKKFKYHHGQLREALIKSAQQLLHTEGIEALSLRALAKSAGVTQAAPYSHFRDKDDLLATIAEAGFQRLSLQMAEDATGLKDASARVRALMASYIRFACENKALFRLMFGREVADMKKYPTLAMTAGKSYSLISAALAKRDGDTTDTPILSVAVWSLCHGLTTLLLEDRISIAQFGASSLEDFVNKTAALFEARLA